MTELNFKIKLWGDRLLVKPDAADEKTKSGIYIPSSVRDEDKPLKGTIVYVGAGTVEKPLSEDLCGQQVMYSKFAGSRLKINGEEYLILRETDVLATVEGDVKIESVDTL